MFQKRRYKIKDFTLHTYLLGKKCSYVFKSSDLFLLNKERENYLIYELHQLFHTQIDIINSNYIKRMNHFNV